MEVSIRQTYYNKLNPTLLSICRQTIHNFYMNISEHKIGAKGILTTNRGKIKLKNNLYKRVVLTLNNYHTIIIRLRRGEK